MLKVKKELLEESFMVNKKKTDEHYVSFGKRKNGKYYAKEELTLEEFRQFLKIESDFEYTWEKMSFWSRMKMVFSWSEKKEIAMVNFYMNLAKEELIHRVICSIKTAMDHDGPGKKVLKK